jgi:hypothetical protein
VTDLQMELVSIVLAKHQNIVAWFGGFNQDHVLDGSVLALSLEIEDVTIFFWLVFRLFSD